MADEKSTDMQLVGTPVKELFKAFFERTGRKLHLELEPGSYYMVNSGSILCEVDDLVDTGKDGFKFLKINTGMDAITRPSLYGARHPIVVVPRVCSWSKVPKPELKKTISDFGSVACGSVAGPISPTNSI
jgi:diaminopimelate decarboxylase